MIGLATFVVNVVDAVTGAEICDATVSYTTETTQGTLTASAPARCEYVGPFEMPGTYEIVATKPGYHAETVALAVGQDDCGHVVTQRSTLSLSPQ